MKISTEMLKGVLEGIVLQIISGGETYGYEITKELNQHGFEDLVEGTVYTILMRLEKNKLVTVEKKKNPQWDLHESSTVSMLMVKQHWPHFGKIGNS